MTFFKFIYIFCLIRPTGESQRITLNARPAEDYPLDLYYLMDLSKSMQDDLNNLKQLGPILGKAYFICFIKYNTAQ